MKVEVSQSPLQTPSYIVRGQQRHVHGWSRNPEIARSNPAPATAKGAGDGAFPSLSADARQKLLPKFCREAETRDCRGVGRKHTRACERPAASGPITRRSRVQIPPPLLRSPLWRAFLFWAE
jgi:hypothetical protein